MKQQASALTYADVHMVLALLQGWGEGTVSLRYDDLAVDLVMRPLGASSSVQRVAAQRQLEVRSPAVGIFRERAAVGASLKDGDAIGVVEAPGRSTPVPSTLDGKLVHVAVPDGSFVEYDQQLATLEPTARD